MSTVTRLGQTVQHNDFLPIVKYDARAGKLLVSDKDVHGGFVQRDVTSMNMLIIFDFGTLQVGPLAFGKAGPVRHMVPMGQPVPERPGDIGPDNKPMFRAGFSVKVAGKALGGVREMTSSTIILMDAIDTLWNEFVVAPEAVTGKIPVVALVRVDPVASGSGAQKSTNYRPIFAIQSWLDRDKVPGLGERTVPAPRGAAQVIQMPAQQPVHAASGSSAPQPPAAAEAALADDEMPF